MGRCLSESGQRGMFRTEKGSEKRLPGKGTGCQIGAPSGRNWRAAAAAVTGEVTCEEPCCRMVSLTAALGTYPREEKLETRDSDQVHGARSRSNRGKEAGGGLGRGMQPTVCRGQWT